MGQITFEQIMMKRLYELCERHGAKIVFDGNGDMIVDNGKEAYKAHIEWLEIKDADGKVHDRLILGFDLEDIDPFKPGD